jgi:molybdopterin converting factor subunit 1
MKVKVLFFAASREAAGKSEESVELDDGATTKTLLEHLVHSYPGLSSVMQSCVFAVNQEYVPQSQALALQHNDEVAIIPPLSGG